MYAVAATRTQAGIARLAQERLAEAEEEFANRAASIHSALSEQMRGIESRIAQLKAQESKLILAHEARRAASSYIPPITRIEQRAARIFKMSRKELRGNRRTRDVAFARQFVMYWAARLTILSYPQIGRLIGGRDHTTVLHGKDAYVEKRKAMGRTLRRAR